MASQLACPACGSQISRSGRYCSACGYALSDASAARPIAAFLRNLTHRIPLSIMSACILLVGMIIGLCVPDLDLRLTFLLHRSIITHGFFAALLIFFLVRQRQQIFPRLFGIGVSLASAIHLCFDLFPTRWLGFALISIPFYGRTTALISWLWIAISIVICLYFAFVLMRTVLDALLVFTGLTLAFAWSTPAGKSVFGFALIALLVASTLALFWMAGPLDVLKNVRARLET